MISFKQLLVRLNQTVRPNMGNALFALFLTLICETVLGMIFAAPAMMIMGRDTEINDLIFAMLLVFCALVVWLLFQYGFHILILRMVRKNYVTLGYVFYGFKKIKRTLPLMLTISLIVSVLTVAVVAGGRIFMAKTGLADAVATSVETSSPAPAPAAEPKAETTEPAEDKPVDIEAFVADHGDLMSSMLKQTGILLAMYFLLIVVVFIHFVFVFYLHFDNPDDSVFTLFKKSAGLMRKNCFRLIRLVFRAGGKNLAVAAAVFALTVIIPDSKTNAGSMRLFVLLLNFVYFINAYTALLKMYFAFPILYTARLEENTFTDEQKDALILAGAVALLSNEESQESSSEQKESDGE